MRCKLACWYVLLVGAHGWVRLLIGCRRLPYFVYHWPFADWYLLLRVAFSGVVLFQFSVLGSVQVSVGVVVLCVRLHF